MSKKLELGINAGLTNEEYHAERAHLSSSNLKMLLDSPAEFHRSKILGLGSKQSTAAMDLGTYVHTLVLEPENLEAEVAVWTGWRKQGKEFDAFKEANKGKLIISKPQQHNGLMLAKTVEACPPALQLLTGGVPELSLASNLLGVPVKMRADYINADQSYIVDLKTSRYPIDSDIFRNTVKQLGYDLSAALYCDIAHNIYGKLFQFFWVVISKEDRAAVVYHASSKTLTEGAALVNKALVMYKKCKEADKWPESAGEMPKSGLMLDIEEI